MSKSSTIILKHKSLLFSYVILIFPALFMEATAGSFPLDLSVNTPARASVTINTYKPPGAVTGILTLSTYDADRKTEGKIKINGNTSIPLFGASADAGNNNSMADIKIITPVSYWNNGDNTLAFIHGKTAGYTIMGASVFFETSSTPDPGSVATFSTDKIEFGTQAVDGISEPLILTLSNSGTAPLNISKISASAGFTQTNNCSNRVPSGGNCIFDIQFAPTSNGDFNGELTVVSDATNSLETVALVGTGFGDDQSNPTPPPTDPGSPNYIFYNDLNNETRHTYTEKDLQDYWWYTGKKDLYDAVEIVADPDPSGAHANAMRVFYAAGITGRKGISGARWPVRFSGHDELYFAYDVYFEDGTEFARGGKLPRLQSTGWKNSTGTADGTNRWSAGLMWREDGALVSYVYHANKSGKYGSTRSWDAGVNGQVRLLPGQWHRIEVRLVMNTPGVLNGRMQGWFDGKLAFDSSEFMWRMPGGKHLDIGEFMFTTFYGGADSSWAPSTDQHVYFDNIILSTQPITH